MTLASAKEIGSGQIWSPRLGEPRPLAPSLQRAFALHDQAARR